MDVDDGTLAGVYLHVSKTKADPKDEARYVLVCRETGMLSQPDPPPPWDPKLWSHVRVYSRLKGSDDDYVLTDQVAIEDW